MRHAGRVRRLEQSVSPTGAVLSWLHGARRYPTPTDYARSVLELPGSPQPLDGLIDQVAATVRGRRKGQENWWVDRAVRGAIGDAAFLFHLVLVLNSSAVAFADRAELSRLLIQSELARACDEDRRARRALPVEFRGDHHGATVLLWKTAALDLARDVRLITEARWLLERTYYQGQATLFDRTAREWQQLEEYCLLTERMARALTADDLDAAAAAAPDDDFDQRVTTRAADWEEDARLAALHALGYEEAAKAIIVRKLRRLPRVAPS